MTNDAALLWADLSASNRDALLHRALFARVKFLKGFPWAAKQNNELLRCLRLNDCVKPVLRVANLQIVADNDGIIGQTPLTVFHVRRHAVHILF